MAALELRRAKAPIHAKETEDPSERLSGLGQELVGVHHEHVLGRKMLQIALELQRVAAGLDEPAAELRVGENVVERSHVPVGHRSMLVVGDDALDRVADEVHDPRLREDARDPFRDAGIEGIRAVRRR